MLRLPPGTLWEKEEGCVKGNRDPDALDGKKKGGQSCFAVVSMAIRVSCHTFAGKSKNKY